MTDTKSYPYVTHLDIKFPSLDLIVAARPSILRKRVAKIAIEFMGGLTRQQQVPLAFDRSRGRFSTDRAAALPG